MAQSGRKVVRYRHRRRRVHVDFTTIIFIAVFLYLMIVLFGYLTKEKISLFQVASAENYSGNTTYTGIISRDESIHNLERSGYVNYYVRAGNKVSAYATVYTLDETGKFAHMLATALEGVESLSIDSIGKIKSGMTDFSTSFDEMYFDDVYEAKSNLSVLVLDALNMAAVDSLSGQIDTSSFQKISADQSGFIVYKQDSYDGLVPEAVTAEMFDKKNYSSTLYKSGELRQAGGFAYKSVKDDHFSLIFPISESDIMTYGSKTSLQIYLKKIDITTSGDFSIITGADGASYGKIDLDKYGSSYVEDRFIDFEITENSVYGLKIPVSAVTSKSFYTVPVEYLTKGGADQKAGFNKEISDGNGGMTVEFVPVSVYATNDTECYIKSDSLSVGDYVIKPDSGERYQISVSAQLDGVYSANQGYSIFRQVEILTETKDQGYYIIKTGTKYGISPYDHIVLKADKVEENQALQ